MVTLLVVFSFVALLLVVTLGFVILSQRSEILTLLKTSDSHDILKESYKRSRQEVTRLENAEHGYRGQIRSLEKQLKNLNTSYAVYRTANARLQQEMTQFRAKNLKLEQDKLGIEQQVHLQLAEVEHQKEEVRIQRQTIARFITHQKELVSDIARLESDSRRLKREVIRLEQEKDGIQGTLSNKEAFISMLEKRLRENQIL